MSTPSVHCGLYHKELVFWLARLYCKAFTRDLEREFLPHPPRERCGHPWWCRRTLRQVDGTWYPLQSAGWCQGSGWYLDSKWKNQISVSHSWSLRLGWYLGSKHRNLNHYKPLTVAQLDQDGAWAQSMGTQITMSYSWSLSVVPGLKTHSLKCL